MNSFLNALDGCVAPCPFHPVPRIRCKLAAFPKRAIILYFFLHASSHPEIDVVNHFWVHCCRRVAQSELHSASEKKSALWSSQISKYLGRPAVVSSLANLAPRVAARPEFPEPPSAPLEPLLPQRWLAIPLWTVRTDLWGGFFERVPEFPDNFETACDAPSTCSNMQNRFLSMVNDSE